jgi:hypothetical protein
MQSFIPTTQAGHPIVVYRQIAAIVTTSGRGDPVFHPVRDALRGWVRAEGA